MFHERLKASLSLSIGEGDFSIPAGAIERLSIDARIFGFSAEVSFRVSSEGVSDEIFEPFNTAAVIKASLTIENGRLLLEGETPPAKSFLGYVIERRVRETTSGDIQGMPIIERLYTISFADPARVFWSVHRPLSLYANKSIKDVIDGNLVLGLTMEYDWPRLELTQDILCVGLGGAQNASFYDFVIWLVSDLCGVLELEAASGSYRIAKEKADRGTATDFDAEYVESLEIVHPTVLRQATRVLNPFSEATATKIEVANTAAATGVRNDVVAYTQIAKTMEQRAELEGDRLRQRDHHLEVVISKLPAGLPAPGDLLSFGESFSKRLLAGGKTYRVIGLKANAGPSKTSTDPVDLEDDSKRFAMEVTVELERDSDPVPNLPAFERPVYPVLAEARILSASGTDDDLTWHALTGESDSIVRYRVQVPLWNQTVVVPFVPFGESGHFFFPAQKHQRVLVAFDFDCGRIVSFLDWVAKLGIDTQGNQLIMGKHDTSRTVLKHVYTDDSPVFTLARNQSGDMQSFEFSDGRFFLEVKAEESPARASQTYDLTPQAEVAKDSAGAGARSALGGLAGKYEATMSSASGALNAASGELEANVTAAATELSDKLSAVDAALSNEAAETGALADALTQKIADAKAGIIDLLEE